MKPFKIQTDYIKTHRIRGGNVIVASIYIIEDYNPATDGFDIELLSFLHPLTLPVNDHGVDDISTLTESLTEACDLDYLKPGMTYTITAVKCAESDGYPHMMHTWGIESVTEF